MAITSRLNRNVGHENTMTDTRYANVVNAAVCRQKHYIFLMSFTIHKEVKHLLWLRLMGLAETWWMIK